MLTEELEKLLSLPAAQEARRRFDSSKQRSRRTGSLQFETLIPPFAAGEKYYLIAAEYGISEDAVRNYWRRFYRSFLSAQRSATKAEAQKKNRDKILLRLERELPADSVIRYLLNEVRSASCKASVAAYSFSELIESAITIVDGDTVVYRGSKLIRNALRPRSRRVSFTVTKRTVLAKQFVAFVIDARPYKRAWALFTREEVIAALFSKHNRPTCHITISARRPQKRRDPRRKLDFWKRRGRKTKTLLRMLSTRAVS